MTLDYGTIAGVAGLFAALVCAGFCFLGFRRFRAGTMDAVAEVRDDCRKRGEEFRDILASFESSMQTTEELLKEGRLNRSTRAQALKMLRSGMAPETAAGTLGMAAREMRLLARVSELLYR